MGIETLYLDAHSGRQIVPVESRLQRLSHTMQLLIFH
jgi:hypothetical protein